MTWIRLVIPGLDDVLRGWAAGHPYRPGITNFIGSQRRRGYDD
jgi:hypothetical protein